MPENRRFELATEESVSWFKRNTGIVAAIVGVLVIIAAVLLYNEWSKWKEEKAARDQYYGKLPSNEDREARLQALAEIANNHPKTSVGMLAKLDYADTLYSGGDYGKAGEAYQAVLDRRGEKDVYGERAKLGLAYCAQQKRDYDKARELYGQIGGGNGLYAAEAIRMLKLMATAPEIPGPVALPKVEVPATMVPSVPTAPVGTATKGPGN